MTEEQKEALIWRCRDAVAHLKQVVEVGVRGGRYSVTEYRYQLMINEIALAALAAQPDEWQQRAEAAEAIVSDVNEIIGLLTEREWAEHCTKTETGKLLEELITDLHDDASPASGLAELVPDEFTNDEVPCAMTDVIQAEMDGWNACRAEMLRNIEEAK